MELGYALFQFSQYGRAPTRNSRTTPDRLRKLVKMKENYDDTHFKD